MAAARGGAAQQFEARLVLARYVLAQLRLVSQIAMDRQMHAVMAFQEEYSFALCLSGASDTRLPTSVRAAFFNLLTWLWLHRFPHTQIVVPALIRPLPPPYSVPSEELPRFSRPREDTPDAWSAEHRESHSAGVRDFYRIQTAEKMEAAIWCVRRYLHGGPSSEQQVLNALDDNHLTLTVLRHLSLLMRYGFVSTLAQLRDILGPLMRFLDGRTDLLLPRGQGDRSEHFTQTGNSNDMVVELHGDDQARRYVQLTYGRGDPALTRGARLLPRACHPPLEDATRRYAATDEPTVRAVFDVKVEMLRVLQHVMRASVHLKTSRFLHEFRSKAGHVHSVSSKVFTGIGISANSAWDMMARVLEDSSLSLSQPGVRSPFVMLVDLLMYRDDGLFSLALEVLFEECCQAEFFVDSLTKVELLTSSQTDLYNKLLDDVLTLGQIVYCYENWGTDDNFSLPNMDTFLQLKKICDKLKKLCIKGSKEHDTSSREIQQMLQETELLSYIRYTLKLNVGDFRPACRALLARVQSVVCSVGVHCIDGYEKVQPIILEDLPTIMSLLDDLPESALLLAAAFRGNLDLCNQVSGETVAQLGERIAANRRKGNFEPWYLQFFASIVVVGQEGVPHTQGLVLRELRRLRPEVTLHLLNGDGDGRTGWRRVFRLANGFASHDQLLCPNVASWRSVSKTDAELIYYVRSLEVLVGMCRGHEMQNLMSRPFVEALLPARTVILLLLRIDEEQTTRQKEPNVRQVAAASFNIYRYLKMRYLELINPLIYDVDAAAVDADLLSTSMHSEFLAKMLRWIEELLRMGSTGTKADLRSPLLEGSPWSGGGGAASSAPDLSELDEELLRTMLDCVERFFNGPYQAVMKQGTHFNQFGRVIQKYQDLFGSLAKKDMQSIGVTLRKPDALQAAAHRVVMATSASPGTRREWNQSQECVNEGTTIEETQWRLMLAEIKEHEAFQKRMQSDEDTLGHLLMHIADLTDPESTEYRQILPQRPEDSLPDGVDFRRNTVTTEDVLIRFSEHCRSTMRSDLRSVRLVQRALLAMLRSARATGEQAALERCQVCFAKSGVTKLVIQMLHERVALDVVETAWALLVEVLRGSEEGAHVNTLVQQSIYEELSRQDDSGMWSSFSEIVDSASNKVKAVRKLQVLPQLTRQEREHLDEYDRCIGKCMRAMEALRLMVEGHYFPMQQYLYSQVGNSRSCNVPEVTANLLSHLCKDPAATELQGPEELRIVAQILALLTELAQGPNERNQAFLSTLGLIEVVFQLLGAAFERQMALLGDRYPPSIRVLKAQLAETLLALLEGRLDTTVHEGMVKRADGAVLRERIEFVHLYFVFGAVSCSHGASHAEENGSVGVPLTSTICELLAPDADPTQVYRRLAVEGPIAEELLEDFEDAELDELFSEGLSILELIYMLAPHSPEFKKAVYPSRAADETFVDKPKLYATPRHYNMEKAAYHKRVVYRQSFEHLQQFVRTIEVVLNGHVQHLHFQQPLTAMWYVHGATQEHILATVPFSSPDLKAKAFIQMCIEAHNESKLIRKLSRYSIVPARFLKLAQRHLPDGLHRPFQVFLKDDAKLMGQLLLLNLCLSVCLAVCIGLTMDEVPGSPHPVFTHPLWERLTQVMGGLHFACTFLWLALTFCIRVPLKMQIDESTDATQPGFARSVLVAMAEVLTDVTVSWRLVLLLVSGTALVSKHFWLLTFLMLDFFDQSSILSTILSAMKVPAQSLVMTFLGAIIVAYVYAAIGFHYYRDEFGSYCSDNVASCAQNIIYQGTRSGVVGLSGMLELVGPSSPDFTSRSFFDVSYFIVFGIFILNTIVALIVDSFSASRKEGEEREHLLMTQTFISAIDRGAIESVTQRHGIADGFHYHETQKQPKWDYMAMVFHLREKDELDYTGPEQTIRQMIENSDTQWMPLGRSMLLEEENRQAHGNDTLQRIEAKAKELSQSLKSDRANSLQRQVKALHIRVAERIEVIVKKLTAFVDTTLETNVAGEVRRSEMVAASSLNLASSSSHSQAGFMMSSSFGHSLSHGFSFVTGAFRLH
eukprot:TRINITY_DN7787_c1_g1_i3.p1 TRINITY_DN7787_c1_g1~~TRINITY_DN7787_c1_g1_i3.p1  ORF type:complete len:2094 (-),score=438.59 TRINITY_DN7787_c1_g1_i3:166-6282(-)